MHRRSKLLVAVSTVAVLGMVAAAAIVHVTRGERQARLAVTTLLDANARAVTNSVSRHLLQVDGVLASVPTLLSTVAARDGVTDRESAISVLRGLNSHGFLGGSIMLVTFDGTIWASSHVPQGGRLEGVDPAALTGDGAVASTLIGPVRNHTTGDWMLLLARPVAVPGRGGMAAVAEIPVPMLAGLMAEVKLDVHSGISLERRNGQVLATLPYDDSSIGKIRTPPGSVQESPGGVLTITDGPAGERSFAVLRQVLFGEVDALLAIPERAALADWNDERDRAMAAALATTVLILMVATVLLMLLRQSERMAKERARVATVLETAIDGMADGFVMWDENDRLVTCNEVYRELYSISRPFLVPGTSFEEIMRRGAEAGQYPVAEGRLDEFVQETIALHRTGAGAIERLLPDGRWLLVRERRMASGGIVGIRTDVTAIKNAQAELAAATERANEAAEAARQQNRRLEERDRELHTQNALFQAALSNMPHGLLMVDADERLIVANPRLADVLGISPGLLLPGLSIWELHALVREAGILDPETLEELRKHQTGFGRSGTAGAFVTAAAGGRAISVRQRPLHEGGWIAIYEDVTNQKLAERRVHFLAHHDDLTKLPNRARFGSEVERRLRGLKSGGRGFALLYLDLDRFKDVNDTFGHPTGDALLEEVAARLRSRLCDADMVARLGGDEFAIIRSGELDHEHLSFGERLVSELKRPFHLRGRKVAIGVSIGVAPATREVDSEELLRNADLALYQAKSLGRGRSCLYEPALELRRSRRLLLEQDLREAMDRNALSVAYQPIFDLGSGRVSGFEALVRWQHPERGWISPSEFVPLAEEVGLVDAMGKWVLRTACRAAAQLPAPVGMAVNLSAQQLRSDDVVEMVSEALRESRLAPTRLELEITETALLIDHASSADTLERLSALGARIALDDFGTGYSSLSHLRNFPLDKIKIDKSFVGEMTSSRDSAAIVASIIDLAGKLGMVTTAEGIETVAQLRAVRTAGCTEAQGYLLGRPASILHAADALGRTMPRHWTRGAGRRSA